MFYNPIEDKVLGKEVLKAVASNNPNSKNLKEDTTYNEARKILSKGIGRNETTHIFIGSNKGGVGKSMTSLQIARGKIALENLQTIIDSNDCQQADFSALAKGLKLVEVEYDENLFIS